MNKLSIITFCLLLSIQSLAQQTINATLTHDGELRDYSIYIPKNYTGTQPVPLLFNFHGLSSTATAQSTVAGFETIADTAGFILVHPQGLKVQGLAHWNVGGFTSASTVDDVGFTEAMIDSISANYNINAKRIYSTGYSNGGFFSFRLACELSDKIAAIASNAGTMTNDTYNSCNPTHPTPVLQIHGTNDPIVPYNGNSTWGVSMENVLKYWIDYNKCDTVADTIIIADTVPSDGSTAEHFIFKNGNEGVTVEHFKVTNGAHDWPGFSGNMDFSASAEIWKFLSRYELRTTSIKINSKKSFSYVSLYPNPASGTTTLSLYADKSGSSAIVIYDLAGKEVYNEAFNFHEGQVNKTLNISTYPTGIYTVQLSNNDGTQYNLKLVVQ